MRLERKFDLSVYHLIKDIFTPYPFVNVVDSFPDGDLVIPTVSVDFSILETPPAELGNRHGKKDVLYYIDVFAINKSQRDEFAYAILDELENSVPVYDYDEGLPPSASPTQLGCLVPTQPLRLEIIRIMPELVDKMYYRSQVTFSAEYNKL